MRETYQLSDQTLKVLKGHIRPVADEMGKSDKYLYAVLAGTETDVFAKFKPEYAAAVRAGAPVHHWDDWFAAVRQRYQTPAGGISPIDALIAKIRSGSETTAALAAALQDGTIDARESTVLMVLITKERQLLDQIEAMVLKRKDID